MPPQFLRNNTSRSKGDHMPNTAEKFIALAGIITRLRSPDGCPWDRKQTPQTFKSYLVEETHELLEAINEGNPEHVCEELGDLLFQVLFLSSLYQENQHFSLADVIDSISTKMIRRHPHVFADETITDEQEQRHRWQAIKEQENIKKSGSLHALDAVPASLPALQRAQRVAERAAGTGFAWPDTASALGKAEEELAELKEALAQEKRKETFDEFGDLLFALAVFARTGRMDGEEALNKATDRFISRFKAMENLLRQEGKRIGDTGATGLLAAWQRTSKEELAQKTIDSQGTALL